MFQKLVFMLFKIVEILLALAIVVVALIPKDMIQNSDVENIPQLEESKRWKIKPIHVFCSLNGVNGIPDKTADVLKKFFRDTDNPMYFARACQTSNETSVKKKEDHEKEKDNACMCILLALWIAAGTVFVGVMSLVTILVQLVMAGLSEGYVGTYKGGGIGAIIGLFVWGILTGLWAHYTKDGWPFVYYYEPDKSDDKNLYYVVPTMYNALIYLCGSYSGVCLLETICFWWLFVHYYRLKQRGGKSESQSVDNRGGGNQQRSGSSMRKRR